MKNKVFLTGIFGVLLVFGLMLAGCDSGGDEEPSTAPKTLVITGIEALRGASGLLGVFPVGTTVADAVKEKGVVAYGNINYIVWDANDITIELNGAGGAERWVGFGTYDIYVLVLKDDVYYYTKTKESVSIKSAKTTIKSESFAEILPLP
jgi:hypothetical protein